MKTIKFSNYICAFITIVCSLFLFSCSEDDPAPTCNDGIRNGIEVGVDCGGQCPPCFSCVDGVLNGNETGIDCGGDCIPCSTCVDGIQNGDETGVDCGGPNCSSCQVEGCTDPNAHNYDPVADTDDGSCETCSDGIQNGDETGIDCGGINCTNCIIEGCTDPDAHNYNPLANQSDNSCETCTDEIFNGDEEGLDCGGTRCEPCPNIGEGGPAGGLVFYDKGSYSNGWRYLEFGIEIQNGDKEWGCLISNTTSILVGSGYENTMNVVNNYNNNNCSQSPEAFLACSELQHNGFTDWYLPSLNEMIELYPYRGQVALTEKRYWCSSESSANVAYVVDYGGEEDGIPFFYTWGKIEGSGQGLGSVVAIRRF